MKNKYFWIKDEGEQTVDVKYTDINNNSGTIAITAKLDRTPPEIGNIVNSVNGLWTRFDVTITAYATDKISGVNKIVYGTADHEKTTNDYSGKWTSEQGFKTKNAKAIKEWKAADRDISMFIEAVDEAGNKATTCNSNLNGHCYTNVRQDVTAPTININDPNDKWHCGRGISGNGYNCDIYVYYFHDNLSGVYKMKHGHCYNGYNCTDYSGAKAKLDSKTLETRDWADSGWRRIEYCMNAGYTAYIYFEVCDRVDNCAIFGPYTDKVNDSPACTALG